MDSTGFLNLAEFYVKLSQTHDDISLRVWMEDGSYRFHLTNNHKQQQTFSSLNRPNHRPLSSTTFTPPASHNSPNNNSNLPSPLPTFFAVQGEEVSEDLQAHLSDGDGDVHHQKEEPVSDPQRNNSSDTENEPDLDSEVDHRGFPKRNSFKKRAVFSPCLNFSVNCDCILCIKHLIKNPLKYVCSTHMKEKRHWHEKRDTCSLDEMNYEPFNDHQRKLNEDRWRLLREL